MIYPGVLDYKIEETQSSLLTGLKAYWKLDESTGSTTLYDSAGIINLSLNRNPSVGNVDGIINNCVQFDISTSSLTANYPYPAIDPSGWTEWSISFWAYFNSDPCSLNRDSVLFRYNMSNASTGLYHLIRGIGTNRYQGNQYHFYVHDVSRVAHEVFSAPTYTPSIVADQWQHVAISYKMNNQVIFWVNDVSYQSGDVMTKPIHGPSSTFNIGNSYSGYANAMTSHKLDEIGIWNRALTSTDVSLLYNNGSGLSYPFI